MPRIETFCKGDTLSEIGIRLIKLEISTEIKT
jgi:hypothetical protein